MRTMRSVRIAGTGMHVPPRVVTKTKMASGSIRSRSLCVIEESSSSISPACAAAITTVCP